VAMSGMPLAVISTQGSASHSLSSTSRWNTASFSTTRTWRVWQDGASSQQVRYIMPTCQATVAAGRQAGTRTCMHVCSLIN
jgi:hypothetical protein